MLILAAGKIRCVQCTAKSKRTGKQCRAPADKSAREKNPRCRFHGGRSTGPKTEEGIQRIREANTKHGIETKQAREERARKNLWFAQVEDVMTVLNMHVSTKSRGPKPSGYKKIETVDAAREWLKTEN